MMNGVSGKVVLITGAKGGLGTFVTEAFLEDGAQVAGVSRTIRDTDFNSERFIAVPAELSSGESARGVVDRVVTRFGRVDALIHLMGGFAGGTDVADTDDETLDRMMDVNLRSTFYITRAVLPHMRSRHYGRIVGIGSRAAIEANAKAGAYSASKAALIALIRAIALENKDHGISANTVLPGTMDTPANRKAMPGADFSTWVQPAQVARLIVSLASDVFPQVTGTVVPVYGSDI